MAARSRKWYILTFIVGVLVLVFGIGFVREQFLIARVVIRDLPEGATIHIDGLPYGEPTTTVGETATITMPLGLHEIGVTKDDYWTWVKRLSIEESETVTVAPFLLPKKTTAFLHIPGTTAYNKTVQAFPGQQLPNEATPLKTTDGYATVWASTTPGTTLSAIMTSWSGATGTLPEYFCDTSCESPKTVTSVQTPIRDLAFFPGRDDLIMFAARDGIFVIEIDTRGVQNFQPIYTGTSPEFERGEGTMLYIKDGFRFFTVNL